MRSLPLILLTAAVIWLLVEHDKNKKQTKTIIMKLDEFITRQESFNASQKASITKLSGSVGEISNDVTRLKDQIAEMQNGELSEDQSAKLEKLLEDAEDLDARATGAAEAADALDKATPPTLPSGE